MIKKNLISILVVIVVAGAGIYSWQFFSNEKEAIEKVDFENPGSSGKTDSGQNNQASMLGAGQSNNLKIEVLKEGSGKEAEKGKKIAVHYVGVLEDGTKFDSSVDREEPFVFVLGAGRVIKGWDEGLVGAKVNEIRRLTIPPHLAYGKEGAANGVIPPNATLIFDIQILAVE